MVFLAELNHDSIVVGVKMVYEYIDDGKHVEIDSLDTGLIGKKYVDGQFVDVAE